MNATIADSKSSGDIVLAEVFCFFAGGPFALTGVEGGAAELEGLGIVAEVGVETAEPLRDKGGNESDEDRYKFISVYRDRAVGWRTLTKTFSCLGNWRASAADLAVAAPSFVCL